MTAQITRIKTKQSNYGGIYYDVAFQSVPHNKFYRSCIYQNCRNFSKWEGLLSEGNTLDNLRVITRNGRELIDADSDVRLVPMMQPRIKEHFVKVEEQLSLL